MGIARVARQKRLARQMRLMFGVVLLLTACANPLESRHLPDRQLRPGETVVITGSGFGKMAGRVAFPSIDGGDTLAPIVDWSDARFTVMVPDDAASGIVRIFNSRSDTPVLQVPAKVTRSRTGIALMVVRLDRVTGAFSSTGELIAFDDSGSSLRGVRVIVSPASSTGDTPAFLLTGSNGVTFLSVMTSSGAYHSTITAGDLHLFLNDALNSGFSAIPSGEVAVVKRTKVTSATTELSVYVHLTDQHQTPIAGVAVVVGSNQCASAPNGGKVVLTTDAEGMALGNMSCPHPQPGALSVDALAAGSHNDLDLELQR